MKTVKGVIVIAAILALGLTAEAKTQMLKSTTPANVSPTSIVCLGTDASSYGLFNVDEQVSLPYYLFQSYGGFITVYSEAGSVATVAIETASTSTGPWFPVTGSSPITNPSAQDAAGVGGESWFVPPEVYVRIHVTAYTSGSIHACLDSVNRINGNLLY